MKALTTHEWRQLKRAAKETGEDGRGKGTYIWDTREDRLFRALERYGYVKLVDAGLYAVTTDAGFKRYQNGRAINAEMPA